MFYILSNPYYNLLGRYYNLKYNLKQEKRELRQNLILAQVHTATKWRREKFKPTHSLLVKIKGI